MPDEDIELRLADLERREAALRGDRLKHELRAALTAAKCRSDGIDDALVILSGLAAPEFDAEGRISKLKVGADEHATTDKAVEAFMATRPHFATPVEAPRLVTPPRSTETPQNKPKTQERSDITQKTVYSPMDLVSQGWLKPPA